MSWLWPGKGETPKWAKVAKRPKVIASLPSSITFAASTQRWQRTTAGSMMREGSDIVYESACANNTAARDCIAYRAV